MNKFIILFTIWLAVVVTIIWVAVHFIAKYW